MRESKIESEVCKYAKSLGWVVFKFSSPGNKGVPDRIFIRNKIIFFIEFKATGKSMRKLQVHMSKKITDQGFEVFEIDNIEDGKKVVDLYEKERRLT